MDMSLDCGPPKSAAKRPDIKSKHWRQVYRDQFHKTKMCRFFPLGECRYGQDCPYAHDPAEITSAPDLRKTSMCADFQNGRCDVPNCPFAHGPEELRRTERFANPQAKLGKKAPKDSKPVSVQALAPSMLTAAMCSSPANLSESPSRQAALRQGKGGKTPALPSSQHHLPQGAASWQEPHQDSPARKKNGKGRRKKETWSEQSEFHQATGLHLQDIYTGGHVLNLDASISPLPGCVAQMRFDPYPSGQADARRGRQLGLSPTSFSADAYPDEFISVRPTKSHESNFRETFLNGSPGATTVTPVSSGSHFSRTAQTCSRDASPNIPGDPAYVIASADFRSVSPGGYSNNSSAGSRSLTRRCWGPEHLWPETPSLSMVPSPNHSPSPGPGRRSSGRPVTAVDVNQHLGNIFGTSGPAFNTIYSNPQQLPSWALLADDASSAAGLHSAR